MLNERGILTLPADFEPKCQLLSKVDSPCLDENDSDTIQQTNTIKTVTSSMGSSDSSSNSINNRRNDSQKSVTKNVDLNHDQDQEILELELQLRKS